MAARGVYVRAGAGAGSRHRGGMARLRSGTRLLRAMTRALLLLLLLLLSRGAHAAETASSVAQDRWIEVRTAHFRLLSNSSTGRVRQIAELLEAFRAFLTTSTKGLDLASGAMDTVLIFKDDASFDPFK